MLEESWKKVCSRITNSIPLLQPEHGICQQNGPERGQVQDWYPMKNWWWSPFVWVINVVPQGALVLHRINKDEGDESVSSCFSKTCCQCNFSEIFKRRQIILEPCRNSKYPIRCLLWWHKTFSGRIWTQAYSEPL